MCCLVKCKYKYFPPLSLLSLSFCITTLFPDITPDGHGGEHCKYAGTFFMFLRLTFPPPRAETYTLIYSFLKKRSHPKAAEAVKRAAKGVVVLRDDIEHRGLELDEIVNEWRTRQIKKVSL